MVSDNDVSKSTTVILLKTLIARAMQYEINVDKFPRRSHFSFVISDDQEVMELGSVLALF